MLAPVLRLTSGLLTTSAGGAVTFAYPLVAGLLAAVEVKLGDSTGYTLTLAGATSPAVDLLGGSAASQTTAKRFTPKDFGICPITEDDGVLTATIAGGGNAKTLTINIYMYVDTSARRG